MAKTVEVISFTHRNWVPTVLWFGTWRPATPWPVNSRSRSASYRKIHGFAASDSAAEK